MQPNEITEVLNRPMYVSGFSPFAPGTGDIVQDASIERQTELLLEQMKSVWPITAGLTSS